MVFGMALGVAAFGCSRVGSVQGDVYLRMANGDVKPMAAMKVYHAPAEKATTLSKQLLAFCKSPEGSALAVARDSASFYKRAAEGTYDPSGLLLADVRLADAKVAVLVAQAAPAVARYKATAATDSTTTDIRAHFQFANIPPGDGILWADVDVGQHTYDWVKRVTVPRGNTATVDLNNETAGEGGVCPQ